MRYRRAEPAAETPPPNTAFTTDPTALSANQAGPTSYSWPAPGPGLLPKPVATDDGELATTPTANTTTDSSASRPNTAQNRSSLTSHDRRNGDPLRSTMATVVKASLSPTQKNSGSSARTSRMTTGPAATTSATNTVTGIAATSTTTSIQPRNLGRIRTLRVTACQPARASPAVVPVAASGASRSSSINTFTARLESRKNSTVTAPRARVAPTWPSDTPISSPFDRSVSKVYSRARACAPNAGTTVRRATVVRARHRTSVRRTAPPTNASTSGNARRARTTPAGTGPTGGRPTIEGARGVRDPGTTPGAGAPGGRRRSSVGPPDRPLDVDSSVPFVPGSPPPAAVGGGPTRHAGRDAVECTARTPARPGNPHGATCRPGRGAGPLVRGMDERPTMI